MRHAVGPLASYLRQHNPDGLIAMMWPMPVIALAARKMARSRTRIVTSDHGMLSQAYRNRPASLMALRLTTRLFYPLAEHRVVASAAIADDLTRISGLSRRGIEVVANPIPMPPPDIAIDEEVDAMWGGEGQRILAVGSFKPEKNHRLLLEAFARVARTRDIRLMIVGEGPLRKEAESLVRQFGLGDRIAMPGFRANLWPIYASADLFALSSDSEGFGNVLVEAMATGLPVVSTDCAGPREVLENGKYGLLVPCDDAEALARAMEQALDGQVDREALKARAREFRPEVAVDRFIDALTGSDRAGQA
jgi:glycosyltransferase involved in cell wall biosynthesis